MNGKNLFYQIYSLKLNCHYFNNDIVARHEEYSKENEELCNYAYVATTDKGLINIDGDRPYLRLHSWSREGRSLNVDFSIPLSGSDRYLHYL